MVGLALYLLDYDSVVSTCFGHVACKIVPKMTYNVSSATYKHYCAYTVLMSVYQKRFLDILRFLSAYLGCSGNAECSQVPAGVVEPASLGALLA